MFPDCASASTELRIAMEGSLPVEMRPQPDETTCGPTCLEAIYRFHGNHVPLEDVIADVPTLKEGGTLGVLLAVDALRRGYGATIYTYNLTQFDPTWLAPRQLDDLPDRLRQQARHKRLAKLQVATEGYIEFIERGGVIKLEDLTTGLIRRYLKRSLPILCGLSATFLYRSPREIGHTNTPDDIRGEPAGHFVVLCGYDPERREVLVADPLHSNPLSSETRYWIGIERVLCAVLLGIVTYDANLLIIEPRRRRRSGVHADTRRRP
jgi:hypothetical protein